MDDVAAKLGALAVAGGGVRVNYVPSDRLWVVSVEGLYGGWAEAETLEKAVNDLFEYEQWRRRVQPLEQKEQQ